MNKVEQVLNELRRQMPHYDAYYAIYDDLEEDLRNNSYSAFSIEDDIETDELGDLLTEVLAADLIWPDDEEPTLHYIADWDSKAGVLELKTEIEFNKSSASDALAKVRRESEVGQHANAHEFNWRQYEVWLLIEPE